MGRGSKTSVATGKIKALNIPEPVGVLVNWQGSTYIGGIQEIVPEFSKESFY